MAKMSCAPLYVCAGLRGGQKTGVCAARPRKLLEKVRKYRAARQEKLGNIVRAKIRAFSADFGKNDLLSIIT